MNIMILNTEWSVEFKSNAREAWLPGIEFVYLCVRMIRTVNLKLRLCQILKKLLKKEMLSSL